MRLRSPLLLLLLIPLLMAAARPTVAGTLRLCNNSDETIHYALVWEKSLFYPISETWNARGWSKAPPGCQDVLIAAGRIQAFMSILFVGANGKERVAHYPFESEAVRNTQKSGTLTAERFFCVTDEPFDRDLPTLAAHETCPAGYYPQLFNLLVTADPDTNFTLRLQ